MPKDKNRMTGGEIFRSLIDPGDSFLSVDLNENVKGNLFTNIIHFIYPFWLRFQQYVGLFIYFGFHEYPQNMVLVVASPLVYVVFWQLKKRVVKFGSNRQTFFTRFAFMLVITAIHVGLTIGVVRYPELGFMVLAAVIGFFWWINRQSGVGRHKHLKGSKEIAATQAFKQHEKLIKPLVESGKHPAEYVNFGGMPLTSLESTTHFFLIAETRGGKSLFISMMLPVLQHQNKRALIYDYAGNYYAKLLALGIAPDRIIILNPFHTECYEWLLSEDLTNPAVCLNFAQKLFPQGNDSKENYFKGYAARVVAAVMMTLNRVARDKGMKPSWGIKEICYFTESRSRIYKLLSTYPDTAEEFEEFADSGSSQVEGVMSTFQNDLSALKPAAECWYRARKLGRTISLKRFPEENKIILLPRDAERGERVLNFFDNAVINYCISQIIGKTTSDESKAAETFFIGDEFHNLGRIEKLPQVTTEGGKYGFAAILASQSIKNIQSEYGEAKAAQILSCITHLCALTIKEPESAEYLSKLFGDTTVMKKVLNTSENYNYQQGGGSSKGYTHQEVTEPLFTPGHFQSQRKINMQVANSIMDATIRCDDMNYRLSLTPAQIIAMLPPKPTALQEAENSMPQDESMMFFQPLRDKEFIALGLDSFLKQSSPEPEPLEPEDDDDDDLFDLGF